MPVGGIAEYPGFQRLPWGFKICLIVNGMGSGANQRHLAFEDIENLSQLIELEVFQESSRITKVLRITLQKIKGGFLFLIFRFADIPLAGIFPEHIHFGGTSKLSLFAQIIKC